MDINHKDGYGTKQPRGQATTLLDLATRDIQDNTLFPLNATVTRFTRNEGQRTVPMSSILREFTFRGPAEFGQRFTFELGDITCGDLIQGLFIQLQFGDWLTYAQREALRNGSIAYLNPQEAWTYSNSMGTAILEEATLEMDDQVLEKITGDSVNVVSVLFPDLNTQLGVADVEGRKSLDDVKAWNGSRILPTDDEWITIPLLFSMLRERLTATFPLIACRSGTVRIRVTLKRFDQVVRILSGSRESCTDTPLGKQYQVNDPRIPDSRITTITSMVEPPSLKNIQLLTYGVLVDGPYREMLLRQPFERPYREIQHFDFTEPLKYLVNKSGNDIITIQLPLEANQPVEEIVWFLRRKAAITLNNDWVNYSGTLEKDYDPVYSPCVPLLASAKIQANGLDIIHKDEAWFRSHISRAHRGGTVAYDSYIYGYSFARQPGEHNPSGTINASRLNSLRLSLDVRAPGGSSDTEWEVHVYAFAIQWLRFANGLCSKVFID
jgi:hypothetical protein